MLNVQVRIDLTRQSRPRIKSYGDDFAILSCAFKSDLVVEHLRRTLDIFCPSEASLLHINITKR